MNRVTLEVCVDSLESAQAAVDGGADRLEVCGSLGAGGGITPSIGLVNILRKRFPTVPLMVMVRPRSGDFCYSDEEIAIMLEDIVAVRQAGAAGVVLGALTTEGLVDIARTMRLATAAHDMEVTFHRAIDMTPDFAQAFEDISKIPLITRVLTSGGAIGVVDGLDAIRALKGIPGPAVLPGSGINENSAAAVLEGLYDLGVRELHMSGGQWCDGLSEARPDNGIDMGGWRVWRTEADRVRAVREIANATISQLSKPR
ncbi:copper homeostasis CutC domain-containing protein [Auriculariales sp. MPI-PUGE-AT-0066]|nr:copper homeostasis CutC domain-containing protein [Auriculariales sp. MPI-PUGE-AT-0066]